MSEHSSFPSPLALFIQGGILLTTLVTEALDLKLSVIGHVVTITAATTTLVLSFILNRKKIKLRLKEWIEEYKNKPPVL